PYVFAWEELEAGCACGTKHALLAFDRGGDERLLAEDHFQLGMFALSQGRNDLAANAFRRAKKLNRDYKPLIQEAVNDFRHKNAASSVDTHPLEEEVSPTGVSVVKEPGLAECVKAKLMVQENATVAPLPSSDHRAQVLEVYKAFGEKVREVLGQGVVLIESDHFLIWTDWEPRYRDRLTVWCESMYAALCEQFNLDPAKDLFLAKCPVFCWRSKARFLKFARQFDGYGGSNAIGYTRSIEERGHVHVVLLRQGRGEADFDRFACTLVHEGTHAFLHRLYSSRLIPHWVNEGYAELMAERVLRDRCPNGENAALLARQFVRYGWPITRLLHSVGPIDVNQYPLAHSVIAYLEGLDGERFAGFIKSLKAGATVAAALSANYDGLTLDQLEARWRSVIRTMDPLTEPAEATSSVLPQATDR
ncbi:MAG: hypothetical protein WBE26_15035, partial [Phycisphaerae bacterium]